MAHHDAPGGIAVVMCVHDPARLPTISESLAAVTDQMDRDRDELVVVVDHHDRLFATLRDQWPQAAVVANERQPGLSGARNTGIMASIAPLIVFLDDDAVPRPHWLQAWRQVLRDPETVMAGGSITPRWEAGEPAWFPDDYAWVVGCDYRGIAGSGEPVRNPIGANMAVRRSVFDRIGGFRTDLGRTAQAPTGCEETELGIRIGRVYGPGRVVRRAEPAVEHVVAPQRSTFGYFVRRCFHEGRSKATLTQLSGRRDSLASERRYVVRSLGTGPVRYGRRMLHGDLSAPRRAAMLLVGLGVTAAGFASARRRPPATSVGAADGSRTGRPLPPAEHGPIGVYDVELAGTARRPLPRVPVPAEVMVRLRGLPVGAVRLEESTDLLTTVITRSLAQPLRERLARFVPTEASALDGPALLDAARALSLDVSSDEPAGDEPLVSVVVCTLGVDPRLREAVESVLSQTHTNLQVLVVDNDPASGGVDARIGDIADVRLSVVREPRRGLSYARNTGLSEAKADIVAFTDDDALPDSRWIEELARVFVADQEERIGCVTGLVAPIRLETRWERHFEEYRAFGRGYRAKVWSRDVPPEQPAAQTGPLGPLFPYAGGEFGSGNNMAFRTEVLRGIGGFDEVLGAGRPVRGGEDLDAFRAILIAGEAIYYTPTALVRHHHRETEEALQSQLFGYGTGMSALVCKQMVSSPRTATILFRAMPMALRTLLSPSSQKNSGKTVQYPKVLTIIELLGYLAGPWLLLRSRWQVWRTRSRR